MRSRSKSSQSSGRRYSGAASTTIPTSRSWWISGVTAQACASFKMQAGRGMRLVDRCGPAFAQRSNLEDTSGAFHRVPELCSILQLLCGDICRRPVPIRSDGQRTTLIDEQKPAGSIDDIGKGLHNPFPKRRRVRSGMTQCLGEAEPLGPVVVPVLEQMLGEFHFGPAAARERLAGEPWRRPSSRPALRP